MFRGARLGTVHNSRPVFRTNISRDDLCSSRGQRHDGQLEGFCCCSWLCRHCACCHTYSPSSSSTVRTEPDKFGGRPLHIYDPNWPDNRSVGVYHRYRAHNWTMGPGMPCDIYRCAVASACSYHFMSCNTDCYFVIVDSKNSVYILMLDLWPKSELSFCDTRSALIAVP